MGIWRRYVISLALLVCITTLTVTGRFIDEDDDDIEGLSNFEVRVKDIRINACPN